MSFGRLSKTLWLSELEGFFVNITSVIATFYQILLKEYPYFNFLKGMNPEIRRALKKST